MKQKIVVKVSMDDQKTRSKALQVAVSLLGVESAALKGQRRDQVEEVGEGIDAVELTRLLRKKVACTELLSVCEALKEQNNQQTPGSQPPVVWWYPPPPPPYYWHPHCQPSDVICPSQDPFCIIM